MRTLTTNWAVETLLPTGRRGGKTVTSVAYIQLAAICGEHVHHTGRDGTWCVTWQPVGFLWARVRNP